jgi:hypothetical protein
MDCPRLGIGEAVAKKTYKVVGTQPVADHVPGEEFSFDFKDQEAALIEGGHIKPVNKSAEKKKEG